MGSSLWRETTCTTSSLRPSSAFIQQPHTSSCQVSIITVTVMYESRDWPGRKQVNYLFFSSLFSCDNGLIYPIILRKQQANFSRDQLLQEKNFCFLHIMG